MFGCLRREKTSQLNRDACFFRQLFAGAAAKSELVLPGHRSFVTDCRARIAELERHHQNRLDEITSVLECGPRSAYETASRMTWDIIAASWRDFPVVQKWFAVSEAASHLRHLVRRKIVIGTSVEGVIQYALVHDGRR